jgi:hypothetical protein
MRRSIVPTCYLHVGTHKTGTKSLQEFLRVNAGVLGAAGIHVPRTPGPPWPPLGGHHNVAWELNGDPRFDPRQGTFAQLLDEIAAVGAPVVCVSSEDFEYLHDKRRPLDRLATGLRSIGYDVKVVVYLRAQADYAESLYTTLLLFGLTASFGEFLAAILSHGAFVFRGWTFRFDYGVLLDAFADVFGRPAIVARSYGSRRPVDALPRDFLGVMSAASRGVRFEEIVKVGRLNPAPTLAEATQRLASNIAVTGAAWSPAPFAAGHRIKRLGGGRFRPIGLRDSLRIVRRFWRDNRRLAVRYGVRVRCVERRDVL